MKQLVLGVLLAVGVAGTAWAQRALPNNAVQIVAQQVKAYNARDIEAFLVSYADSVELYTFPATLISKGKAAMRQRYITLFSKAPSLHCEVTGRLVEGHTVIDQERVTGVGSKALTGVAVYQVEGGKISRVYFIH